MVAYHARAEEFVSLHVTRLARSRAAKQAEKEFNLRAQLGEASYRLQNRQDKRRFDFRAQVS